MRNRCLPAAVRSQAPFPWSRDGGGLGNVSQSFMDPVWGQGQVCFPLFQPQLWFSASPAALLLFTGVVLGLEPIPNAARPCPRVSPENQLHLGIKWTPLRQVGLAAGWSLSQARERLMEPPEGCYEREGRTLYPHPQLQ